MPSDESVCVGMIMVSAHVLSYVALVDVSSVEVDWCGSWTNAGCATTDCNVLLGASDMV